MALDVDLERKKEEFFFERQLVVFTIKGKLFASDIEDIREIIKMQPLTDVPTDASYLKGILNLRGSVIVVADLAEKLGYAQVTEHEDNRILVIQYGSGSVGFIVGAARDVIRVTGDKIDTTPELITDHVSSEYITGVAKVKDQLIMILDFSRILADMSKTKVVKQYAPQQAAVVQQQIDAFSSSPHCEVVHTTDAQGNDVAQTVCSKPKIMIVDDSGLMRSTMKGYLNIENFDIIEADDGDVAIDLYKKERPSLVFMDIKMPTVNGLEAAEAIVKYDSDAHVFMVTSVYDAEIESRAKSNGAKEYLKKPVKKRDVLDVLDKYAHRVQPSK